MGEWQRALEDSGRCVALDAGFVRGYVRRATVLERMGGRRSEVIGVVEVGLSKITEEQRALEKPMK